MDHRYAEEHGLVDRYLQRRLAAAERAEFEHHFMDCPQCMEALEWAESLRGAVRDAAAQERARWTAGLLAGLLRSRAAMAGAVALVALLAAALVLSWLAGRELSGELETARREAAELGRQLAAIERQPAEAPTGPRADAHLFYLTVTRGPGEEPALVIARETTARHDLLLLAELEAGSEGEELRATLERGGETLWQQEGIRPNVFGTVAVTLPAGFLEPGDYRLSIAAAEAPEGAPPLAAYSFRVGG